MSAGVMWYQTRTLLASWILAGSAGCTHESPFSDASHLADTTLHRGTPRQLTFNLGTDLTPAWLNDGTGIVYMSEDQGRLDRDRCLARMAPTGGTIRQITCGGSLQSLDSTDSFYEPAQGPDGRLLFVRESSPGTSLTPSTAALVLGSLADPLSAVPVRSYPYTAPSGSIHSGISHIRWLDAVDAVYLGENIFYINTPPPRGPPDTVRVGIELVRLDLSGTAPVLTTIPNTQGASSVAVGSSGSEIYFTRNGDSRVYHLDLSNGTMNVIHDFGSLGIARDVQFSSNRLIAIVGGKIQYYSDPTLGFVQRDDGGGLWQLDLGSGTPIARKVPGLLFRHPALLSGGAKLVVEAYATNTVGCDPNCTDTTVSKIADLYLFDLPEP